MTLLPSVSFSASRIARARAYAMELIDRLVRSAAPGFHMVAGTVRRGRNAPRTHAGLVIVRPPDPDPRRPEARISTFPGREAFTALLAQGRLTNDPVALLMRSCDDERHSAVGHRCVMRGWISRDGLARPMRAAAIRSATARMTAMAVVPEPPGTGGATEAGIGTTSTIRRPLRSHPYLPPHPPGPIRFETAYPLRPHDPDVP